MHKQYRAITTATIVVASVAAGQRSEARVVIFVGHLCSPLRRRKPLDGGICSICVRCSSLLCDEFRLASMTKIVNILAAR